MASLKFIMDVDDDRPVDSRHTTKKDKDPGPPTTTGPLPPLTASSTSTSASASSHRPQPGHVSTFSARPVEQKNISSAVPGPQTNDPRGLLSRDPELTNTTAASSSSFSTTLRSLTLSSSTQQASNPQPPARRRSTASIDSMDQTGYGSAASSSSMGAGLHHHHHHNNPMRPMPAHQASNDHPMRLTPLTGRVSSTRPVPAHQSSTDLPMRLTPITGRVSRAKKGVPVHVCDACRPAKTFTRAEHLRRHQLSHQNPGHACTYPGCDRTFHRPDLLVRHQQRHEEGDKVSSKSGGNEDDGRASSARSSIDDRYSQGASAHQQPPSVVSPNMPESSMSSAPTTLNAPAPSTPHAPGHQRRISQRSNPGMGGGSPNPYGLGGGDGSTYRRPSGEGPGDYQHYPLPASTVGLMDPIGSSAMGGGFGGALDFDLTTTPPPVRPSSQGVRRPNIRIPDDGTPDLYHARDASPWTSSASDSTYSTPVSDMPAQRMWLSTRSPTTADWPSNQLLSPYPGTAPRDPRHQAGDSMTAPPPPLFLNAYGSSAQYGTDTQQQSFGAMFEVSMASLQPSHQTSVDGAFRSHHRQNNSISSIRSATPPLMGGSHGGETLVAPPMALPNRLGGSLARQKTLLNARQMADAQADMAGIGGLGFGGMDVHGDSGNGLLSTLGLPLNGGCAMPAAAMPMSLPRPVQAVIPHYLEVYWARVHPRLPLVHRPSFETAPEDVLRCAMAAVASQYISVKEDRGRGNQLHEYAWHEAKRVTQWSLQTMQAIFLCEYFARFRGRKTATKPSKLFESLYSRVSSLEFFTAARSVPLGSHGNALWTVDPSGWSSSSSSFSDCSSCDSITPTAATVSSYPNTFPDTATPWGSFPSSYASSVSSGGNGSMLSPSPFPPDLSFSSTGTTTPASFHPGLTHGFVNNPAATSAPSRQGQQRTWSSLFSPGRYNPPLASSFSLHAQSHLAEQTYSQALATLQVLYQNPSAFDPSASDLSLSTSNADRWNAWVDSEARRRLLAACFHLDSHAALLQQQRRAHDYNTATTTPPPPAPLFARSAPLWSAPTPQSWATALASDPDAGMPAFATAPTTTTPDDPFDHMAVLAAEMLKLPHEGEEVRIASLFRNCPIANTYLALHHTPLRDLLAVGGDSWVFAKKVVSETSFAEHQRRLRAWVDGGKGAAKATVYAARAIVGFLDRADGVDGDLSDYWALYACALICWAAGHRQRGRQSGGGGGGGVGEEEVVGWLRGVAATEDGSEGGVMGRREAAGVVGLVRRRLEVGGGAGRLFVDALGVLKRVEEGGGGQGGWRWF